MSDCSQRDAFIVGDLEPSKVPGFEAHLAGCVACQQAVAQARRDTATLKQWAEAGRTPAFAAQKLMARAKEPRPSSRRWLIVVPLAALLALGVWWQTRAPAGPLVLEQAGAVAVFGDTFTVEPDSRAEVQHTGDETRVRVSKGALKFQVAKRKPGARFVVETNGIEVRVVGTTFSVRSGEAPSVAVEEGVVEVWRAGTRVAAVSAGETWPPVVVTEPVDAGVVIEEPVDAGVVAPRPRAVLDVEAVTRLLVDRRFDEAQRVLDTHLAKEPRDARAWTLMGNLFRRSGALERSVEAYAKAATFGDVETRTRARLVAAGVLQDSLKDGARARVLLEACLAEKRGPKALEAPVLVRLARLDVAEGKTAQARTRLELVLKRHATTPSAVEARTLLESLR
ncbi:MAG: FecR domain-containing protein [Myxococcaceae bacterium]